MTYESPNKTATVNEYGYPAPESVSTFLAKQRRQFGIPSRPNLRYFAEGTRGAWQWLAESWVAQGLIHYDLIFLNGSVSYFMDFTY
ncbi:MAG: hypothetical protein OWR62_15860, partial [Sulfobacillus thermotolerans]|nr:hypothetical protein [Sulfobacillus thermotolerans]